MFIVLGYTRGCEDPDDIDIHVETALADVEAMEQWRRDNPKAKPVGIVRVDGGTAYTVKMPLNLNERLGG